MVVVGPAVDGLVVGVSCRFKRFLGHQRCSATAATALPTTRIKFCAASIPISQEETKVVAPLFVGLLFGAIISLFGGWGLGLRCVSSAKKMVTLEKIKRELPLAGSP